MVLQGSDARMLRPNYSPVVAILTGWCSCLKINTIRNGIIHLIICCRYHLWEFSNVLWKNIPTPCFICHAVTPFTLPLALALTRFACYRSVFSARVCNSITAWQHPHTHTTTFFCGFWLDNLSASLVHTYLSRWLCYVFRKHHQSCVLQIMFGEDGISLSTCSHRRGSVLSLS